MGVKSGLLESMDQLQLNRATQIVRLGSAIILTGVSIYGCKKWKLFNERRRLAKLVKRRKAEREAAFAALKAKYALTPDRLAILEIPMDDLIDKLQSREVTATEVLEAFIAKSLEITERLNCVTEYIPQAIQLAEKLDSSPLIKGPLHGIPFAVKDDHDIKGMDSTMGYAKHLYNPAAESAAIIKVLRDLGAVPFCRTNIPMSELSFGSENPIYGTTLNAHFPERQMGPGGSSSGSGALVGAGGAIFALGTDIGGSVRLPAHFNGISGIRTTTGRLCTKGMGTRFLPGSVGVQLVTGILTPVPMYLALVFKSIVEGDLQRKYDGTVVPIPWNAKMFNSTHSLRIGYYTSLPAFPAFKSTVQMVQEAKEALEKKGHILVPFDLPSEEEFQWSKLISDFFFADLGQHLRTLQYGEESSRAMRHLWIILNVPVWARRIGSCILQWIPGCQHIVRGLRAGFDADTGAKLWACVVKQKAVVDHLLSSMNDLNLDLILCPVFPCSALGVEDHHRPELFADACCYTLFWNLVDMPAGVVRFGTEMGGDDADTQEGGLGRRMAKEALEQSIGMPIGLQVVGKRFEEEMVLRLMTELDDIYQVYSKS